MKPEILEGTFAFPVSDGTGENREGRVEALALLEAAGYKLDRGVLVDAETGEPFAFEILATTRAEERLLLTYARALKLVGIDARIRQVDSAQYQRRKQTYDFDMIQFDWGVSLSPGNEQSFRLGSEAAAVEGTFNYAGVKSAGRRRHDRGDAGGEGPRGVRRRRAGARPSCCCRATTSFPSSICRGSGWPIGRGCSIPPRRRSTAISWTPGGAPSRKPEPPGHSNHEPCR